MVTADQLVAHAVGDYLLQSDWMATEKVRQSFAAAAHAFVYSLPFWLLTHSAPAVAVIIATHFVIDRWRLARYVCWAKNQIGSPRFWRGSLYDARESWRACSATGYAPDRPVWLAVWLLIIADNTLHVLCNAIALRWF